MATRLKSQIFPVLQLDSALGGKALLLVGPSGVGKSHLLAAISSIGERGELTENVTNQNALITRDGSEDEGVVGVGKIAGRFCVIRATVDLAAKSLREFLVGQFELFLAKQEISYRFSLEFRRPDSKASFDDMMAAFHEKFPEHGLMVVIDDLLDFLKSRNAEDLDDSLGFLADLCEASRDLRFRFIAAARESIFDCSQLSAATNHLQRLRHLCVEVVLEKQDLHFAKVARLVHKTPEQRGLVDRHLTKFAKFYSQMGERMGEFVDLFPIHPDYIGLLGRYSARVADFQILSEAVGRRLEDEVPTNDPGIIAYDNHWNELCIVPTGSDEHELVAVQKFSRLLEQRVERSNEAVETKAIARRIIRAISVQRLAASDMYCECGVTPDELRESLCLYYPDLDVSDRDPSEALLVQVKQALEAICQGNNDSLLTVHCRNNQYHLHFRKFRRFIKPELILHWVNALPFLLLMVTGGVMLGSRFSHLDRQLFSWAVTLHKACAFTWLLGLPLSLSSRPKFHWRNIRTFFTWGAKDAAWMIQSARSLYNKSAVIPPAGRFNTGQKINACLVILYYFGFGATGVLMFSKGTILFPWYIHTALFFSAMGSVGGHLFLALINPSTRIAIAGIFHGWAPMKYVEHHHALSLPKSLQSHAEKDSARAVAEEVFVSKVEVGVLVGTILLAGAGIFAFGQGRMATAKNQFDKGFADLIQPSQLTTKHRIGPTAESCTKCHLFTGEIPNQKCEQCHLDVKSRRAEHIGFHGTLKGDCRSCHREHREHTAPLVPLDRNKFDHNEALFKLEGKHAAVKCEDCHKETRKPDTPGIYYIGLKHDKCADCHRDQHAGQFAAKCETCHTPAGWTGKNLKFRHEKDSEFPLAGLHATVECRKCHQPPKTADSVGLAKFKGLPKDCAGCHEDPHRGQFATRCSDCHTPVGWHGKNLNFVHDKNSRFLLVASHAQVACEKCHQPLKTGEPLGRAQFRGLKTECADCHQDPHRGQFARDCTKCHATPNTWAVTALKFEHDRDTEFTLLGKHSSVDCIKCHKPRAEDGSLASAKFKSLETACSSCHAIKHPEWYGSTCTACHTPSNWIQKEPTFDHTRDARFELAGKHFVAKCSACHTDKIFAVLDHSARRNFTCLTCHQKDEPHKSTLGTNCSQCHSPIGWKGEDLLFDHNTMASFGLNADHENVSCVKCHKNRVWKPLDSACSSCHTKFFLDSRK